MRNEQFASARYPASPLSPKSVTGPRPSSPQAGQRRGNHGRQTPRNMHINLGRFHPSNFGQGDVHMSTVGMPRAPQPVQMESARLMKEKQREFLERARLNQKLAASPFSTKPDAPRLDPLGSPTGAVTPLALEDSSDYFQFGNTENKSPVPSPGSRSPRSGPSSTHDDTSPNKSRKLDVFQ